MLHKKPHWNDWVYDDELRILSYPEHGYGIDIGDLPTPYRFYIKDRFACLLEKRGMTDEIYAGLANACEEVVAPGMRAVAVEVQRDYRASKEVG